MYVEPESAIIVISVSGLEMYRREENQRDLILMRGNLPLLVWFSWRCLAALARPEVRPTTELMLDLAPELLSGALSRVDTRDTAESGAEHENTIIGEKLNSKLKSANVNSN